MGVSYDNQDSDYLKGGSDDTLIGNVADRLKVIDEDLITAVNGIAGVANIIRYAEIAVTSRTETDLSTPYTVAAGKTFAITSFVASYDAQAAMYVRVKKQTGGVGPFVTVFRMNMMSGGQGNSTISFDLGSGIDIGVAGDVFKMTYEASIAKGTISAVFAGSEY